MPVGTAVPVDEYLRTSYEPDMDYIDGQLVERSTGERRHSRIQAILIILLGTRQAERGFEVFAEQRIVIVERRRYLVPDICVKAVPYNPVPVLERPDLVIEILSPDDTLAAAARKCALYREAGIPAIWVVDPYRNAIYTFDAEGLELKRENTLSTELTGPVDFAAVFGELDKSGQR
jgi:Uma2 family endonuclease